MKTLVLGILLAGSSVSAVKGPCDSVELLAQHMDETLKQFMDLKDGGIVPLRSLERFATNLVDAFLPLIAHLDSPTRIQLEARMRERVRNKLAGNEATRRSAKPASGKQVQDCFYWIVEAHNEWLTRNPLHGPKVDLKTLSTKEGALQALASITRRESYRRPEAVTRFVAPKEGGVFGFPSHGIGRDKAVEYMISLTSHLNPARKKELERMIRQRMTQKNALAVARANVPGQLTAGSQVMDCLHWVVEGHNEWLREDSTRGSEIDLRSLSERGGVEKALASIQGRFTASTPEMAEIFRNKSKGSLELFRAVGFGVDIVEVFCMFVPHIGSKEKKEVEKQLRATIQHKKALYAALQSRSYKNASRQILDGFHLVVQAHNQWVKSGGKGEWIDADKIHTRAGALVALRILQESSRSGP